MVEAKPLSIKYPNSLFESSQKGLGKSYDAH